MTALFFEWTEEYIGYANLLMGIFTAPWLKLLFWKYDYNIFEIVILQCFLLGTGMLMITITGVIESIIGLCFYYFSIGIYSIYTTWAIVRFYKRSKFINYFKALFAYAFGVISSSIFLMILGHMIDLLIENFKE